VSAARLSGGYCTLTFQIRQLSTADYPVVISVIDQWWGGRAMADKLPRLFFEHFTDTSFAAERDRKLAGFLAGFISQSRPGEACIHFAGVDPAERGSGLGRPLYEAFFAAAEARGCVLVRAVTSPVNRGSVAFHHQMGFQPEPGDAEVDGVPVSSGYDGHGGDRVGFIRSLRGADLLLTPQRPGDSYGGQVIAPRTSIPVRSERQVIRKNCRA
jgi:predicted GNAT superfamily acetyltransferase